MLGLDWRYWKVKHGGKFANSSDEPMVKNYELVEIFFLFLGHYQFRLAPVELMFSYIKNRDLNPLNTKALSG